MTTLREHTAETSTHEEDSPFDETTPAAELETAAAAEEADEHSAEDVSDDSDGDAQTNRHPTPIAWVRVLAFGLLPGIALLLALTAGYFKWVDLSGADESQARAESVRAASDDAVALLSYGPDSAEKELDAARERLTGEFKDAYTSLTRQVVIPGAKQKHIMAAAKVTAASSVSATQNHAVVLLFVNQTVTVGDGGTPPTLSR